MATGLIMKVFHRSLLHFTGPKVFGDQCFPTEKYRPKVPELRIEARSRTQRKLNWVAGK